MIFNNKKSNAQLSPLQLAVMKMNKNPHLVVLIKILQEPDFSGHVFVCRDNISINNS